MYQSIFFIPLRSNRILRERNVKVYCCLNHTDLTSVASAIGGSAFRSLFRNKNIFIQNKEHRRVIAFLFVASKLALQHDHFLF